MWDVSSTEFGGSINLSDDRRTTLLGTHFRDFVYTNDAGTTFFKEEEDVTVFKTPSMTKELGERQVAFDMTNWELSNKAFKDGAPKRDKETATYIDDDKLAGKLIAYVPEEVCEDLESLYGKELKVIFGDENVVALIAVTNDDVIDNEYITKYVAEDKEVVIGGETYKLADTGANTKATVNNVEFGKFDVSLARILGVQVGELTSKKFDKKIEANVILNSKGKVTEINMYVSGDYADFYTNEFIVGRVRNEKIQDHTLDTIYDYYEIEEEDLPKVYIDGVKASIDEIEVGDVLTVYYADSARKDDEVVTIYASRATAEGEVTDITSKNKLDVDGEEYTMSKATALLVTDEIKDASTEATADFTKYYEENVTLHLNIYGEYVAVVAEENIADYMFGIADYFYKAEEDADGVYTQKLRIFLNGARNSDYKLVYDSEANNATIDALADDADDALNGSNTLSLALSAAMNGNAKNALIAFKADANNEIALDDIIVVDYDNISNGTVLTDTDYEVFVVGNNTVIDYENKRITIGGRRYNVTDAEIAKSENGNTKPESVTWKNLVNQSTKKLAVAKGLVIVEEGKYDALYVYTQDAANGGTDLIYAVVKALGQVKKINGKTYEDVLTLATEDNEEIFVDAGSALDGNEDENVIVSYKSSADVLSEYHTLLDVEILNSVKDNEEVKGIFNNTFINNRVGTPGVHDDTDALCDCGGFADAVGSGNCSGEATHIETTDADAECACQKLEAPETTDACSYAHSVENCDGNIDEQGTCSKNGENGCDPERAHKATVALCDCGGFEERNNEGPACNGDKAHIETTDADAECACGHLTQPDDYETACTGYVCAGSNYTKAALRVEKVDGEYLVYVDTEDNNLPEVKVCDVDDVVVFDATGSEIVVSSFGEIVEGDLVVPFVDGNTEAVLLVIVAE